MAKHEKRRVKMIQRLEAEGKLYLQDMADYFGVSKETIRQDFHALAQMDTIGRIHGGIQWEKQKMSIRHYIFEEQKMRHIESKKAIAYKALSHIENGNTLFLDTGSTVACLFQYLSFKKNLTIITSSIPLLMSYLETETKDVFGRCGHQFIFVGGHVNHGILGTHGPFLDQTIRLLNIDVLFFSCDAFDLEKGMSNADDVPFSVIQTVKDRALKSVALIDHSKVKKLATFHCMSTKQLDVLITDFIFSAEEKNRLENLSVTLSEVKTS